MARFSQKVRAVRFGKPVLLALMTIMSFCVAANAQLPKGVEECEGNIAFSKHVYEVAPDIFLLGVGRSQESRLTNSSNNIYLSAEQPSWSRNGDRIIFTGQVSEPAGGSAYNMDIFVMDADSSHVERLTHTTSNEIHPVFSPDGNRVSFATDRDGNWEVYVMNTDGSNPINLTNSDANDGEQGITWSPDGSHIAFVTDQGKGQTDKEHYEEQQIYLIDGLDVLQNGAERHFINLTKDIDICPAGEFYSSPVWSNSGQRLAFSLSCGALNDIYVMDIMPDGNVISSPVNLTDQGETSTTSDGFLGLSWSPNDRQIVFVSSPEGQGNYGGELLAVNVDEEDSFHQLTHYSSPEVFVAYPAWQPCQARD